MNDTTLSRRRATGFGRSGRFRGPGPEAIKWIAWCYLKLTGWRAGSDWPDVPKAVIVAAPHTSNWDGLTMLAFAGWYRVKLSWMGKAALVKGPFGPIVRWSGCVPVERSSSNDVVTQMCTAFSERASLFLAVAPEGTRDPNPDWKTGFYHIAHRAGVPLLMAVLDYGTRTLSVDGPLQTSGNLKDDMDRVLASYATATGKFPERFVKPPL